VKHHKNVEIEAIRRGISSNVSIEFLDRFRSTMIGKTRVKS